MKEVLIALWFFINRCRLRAFENLFFLNQRDTNVFSFFNLRAFVILMFRRNIPGHK